MNIKRTCSKPVSLRPLVKMMALPIIVILMSSCNLSFKEDAPVVTKIKTVQEYNSALEIVNELARSKGWEETDAFADEYYNYVLYDYHRRCSQSAIGDHDFRTQKHSRDEVITKYDLCIQCRKEWSEHRKF